MEPLTHALVGIGIAALSGDSFSLANAIQLGVVLGALAPDLDIVLQLFGDVPYLTHHRGSSHSIPGILFSSAVITCILWLIIGGAGPGIIFLWTLLGSVSHILLDILNSYGAKIFWPFSQKKYSMNLLVAADPIIIALFMAAIFWPGMSRITAQGVFWSALVYLGIRFYMRLKVHRMLSRKYLGQGTSRVVVMPAMISLWNWSFLIETDDNYIIGEVKYLSLRTGIKIFSPELRVKLVLDREPENDLTGKALNSKVGRIFQAFTPYYYIHHCLEEGRHVVRFCDLRYFFREDFLHHATVIFDETYNIIDAVFQPYNRNRKNRVVD
jgi:inner membrane protein